MHFVLQRKTDQKSSYEHLILLDGLQTLASCESIFISQVLKEVQQFILRTGKLPSNSYCFDDKGEKSNFKHFKVRKLKTRFVFKHVPFGGKRNMLIKKERFVRIVIRLAHKYAFGF